MKEEINKVLLELIKTGQPHEKLEAIKLVLQFHLN